MVSVYPFVPHKGDNTCLKPHVKMVKVKKHFLILQSASLKTSMRLVKLYEKRMVNATSITFLPHCVPPKPLLLIVEEFYGASVSARVIWSIF